MGNICGKTESEPSQPGRLLGSAPPPGPKTSRVPQKVGGPPRTLGSAGDANSGDASDARRKAAEAAEVRKEADPTKPLSLPFASTFLTVTDFFFFDPRQARAKASSKGGKLQSQLNAQKKQNRLSTLAEASNQELRARDADEAAQTRNWE